MAKYICRNCGFMQYSYGTSNSGCALVFWIVCLILTILIGLFAPVAFIVVLFEILFIILVSKPNNTNICFECKAKDCIVPLDTPAGRKIYKDFFGEEYEEKRFFKTEEEIKQSFEDKKKK